VKLFDKIVLGLAGVAACGGNVVVDPGQGGPGTGTQTGTDTACTDVTCTGTDTFTDTGCTDVTCTETDSSTDTDTSTSTATDTGGCVACACFTLVSQGGCAEVCGGVTPPDFCSGAKALLKCGACIHENCGHDPSMCM
jgi:hypothetical protein